MTPRTRIRRPFMALFALGSLAGGAEGQECSEGRISYVFVDNHSVFDTDQMHEGARLVWAYRLANTVHMDTSEDFILDEVLFEPGDCYDPELLAESERLLRRHPFIAQSDVYGIPQTDGSWHVVVDTKDEWTTKVNLRVRLEEGFEFSGADITEENFLGRGHLVGVFFRQREEKRDFGARLFTPRLLGTRLDARLEGGRTRVGSFFRQELFYPFVGEVGRLAGRQLFSRRDDLFPYSTGTAGLPALPDASHVLLAMRREVVEVTLAARVGDPGNLTVFGLGFSDETLEFPDFPESLEFAVDGDFGDAEPSPAGTEDLVAFQTLHGSGPQLRLLFGQRNIRFVQRTGLDALQGVQDVQIGTDLGLTIGRSIGVLTSGVDDIDVLSTRLRAFGGVAAGSVIANAAVAFDGRQVLSGGRTGRGWRNLVAEGDALLYWQPQGTGHTVFARVAAAGGWNMTLPYQLTLGGADGVRGFLLEDFPGSERLIATVEDRLYVRWPFPERLDFGLTVFADAGRVWRGEAPFGVSSGWKGTVGGGLRFGFPNGTRGVVRVDVGYPLGGGDGRSSPVFRVSFDDLVGLAAGLSDRQLDRSRVTGIGPDLFTPGR